METQSVPEQAHICQGTAACIVDMEGNDVITCYKGFTGLSLQVHLDILSPCVTAGSLCQFYTIDVQLEVVIVRIDNPQVLFQILLCKGYVPAYIIM